MGSLAETVDDSNLFSGFRGSSERCDAECGAEYVTPNTPDYSPGDFGAHSPGDRDSDYSMDVS